MAERCVAFLRAINVGGHTVRMEVLRSHFEELGLRRVSTFIASGNVIFDEAGATGRRLESRIERHLESNLGYAVATFVRTIGELAEVIEKQPFPAGELAVKGHRLYVAFLRARPSGRVIAELRAATSATDVLEVVGRELYWLSRIPMSESTMSGARIEKLVSGPTTVRNMNTVNRLLAKYGDDAGA